MSKNPQYESMRSFFSGEHKIRVWITEEECGSEYNANNIIGGLVKSLFVCHNSSIKEKLAFISGYDDKIAAVEVLDCQGNGALVYPDWK